MTSLSNNRITVDGDIDSGRGQLGLGWSGSTISTSLWSLYRGANHYIVDPTSASTIITLPAVGTASSQAQSGHWLTIANVSSTTNNIVINNNSATTITTITPGNSAKIIANSSTVNNWVIQYNTSNYTSTTLQQAYDASGAITQIVLSNTNGSLKINDATTPLLYNFEIYNNIGSYHYFASGNFPSGTQNPYIIMLGSTANASNTISAIGSATNANNSVAMINSIVNSSGTNSFSVAGSTVNAANTAAIVNATVTGTGSVGLSSANVASANTLGFGTITTASGASGSVAFCDSGSVYTGYSLPNVMYNVFRGGEQHFGGSIRPGTSRTSPNQCNFYVTNNGVTTTGVTINLIGSTSTIVSSFANSTYSITLQIYGRDATSPSLVSLIHEVNAVSVTNASNVPTLLSQRTDTSQTVGFTNPGSITLATTATDLTLFISCPDNVTAPAGAGMDFRIFGSYRVITE